MSSEPLRLDVNPQLECAETLASRYYTDPAMLSLEKERIFRRTRQLVGTLSRSDVAGEPVVVTRDKAGTLHAFSNVCRHRAGPIAQGAGCKHVLNCAYHRWTYTLGGRLIGTPEIDGLEFFDRSTMGMLAFVVLALRTAATARTGFGEPSRSLPWGNGCCR